MCFRVAIYCLLLGTATQRVLADEGDYISIFTTRSWVENEDVSIILANMDNAPGTFEIENIGMEQGDVLVSTTVDPKHVQLYVIPSEWSATGEESIQLDIVTSAGQPEEARLTAQIERTAQPKVLIQLSDVFHTPGDFLKYRILLTDGLNKPLGRTKRPFNLTIVLEHDTQQTVVSRDVQLYPGEIYSGEHLFVDDRDLGNWTVAVTIGEQTTSKQFQVILYSAPVHQITIDTGELITLQDTEITITIDAMYSFGKPIRGTLQMKVYSDENHVVERTFPIAGRKMVQIPMQEVVRKVSSSETKTLNINATVTTTNGLTQRTYNQARAIPMYASPYKLVVERTVGFTPGQNATVFLKILRANGAPLSGLEDDTEIVSFTTDDSGEVFTANLEYRNMSASITLEPAYSPQLYVRILQPKQYRKRDAFKLAIVASYAIDGVLTIIRKHNGENVPHYIECNMQNYKEVFVPTVRLQDVKRVYVFARFEGTLIQASASYNEPALSEKVHLSVDERSIKVFSNEDASRVGIAVYEGSLDAAQLKNIYTQAMFNGTTHPKMIVTAFVFSPTGGLGIAEPIQWQRQQDIEIYLHIPYSAKKLEPVTVDVYIVNNRNEKVDFVLVELLNYANEFYFLNNSGRIDATKKTVYGRLRPNEVQRTEFLIRPKKLGSITLKANAYTESNLFARAETILRTIPESVRRTDSIVRLFNVDNSSQQLDDVKLPIPRTVDPGTEKITFTLDRQQTEMATLTASMLLDKLIQTDPLTMAMRAALTLEVLALAGLQWNERKALAERQMNESITKIMAYKNADGSFTIPDHHTPSSACWDTAIAVQALTFANDHLGSASLAETILKTLQWIKSKQAPDGRFCTDDGEQSELERVEKTAHVLLLLLHMKNYIMRHVSAIDSARNYLLSSTSTLQSSYHLALVGHVLQLSLERPTGTEDRTMINRQASHILIGILQARQQSASGSKMWWNKPSSTPDLEATAYALMLMTSKKYLFDAGPVVNWMKEQPYRRVVNASITPNSHIALRALIDYAKRTTFLEKRYIAKVTAKDRTGVIARHELTHRDSGSQVWILPSSTRTVSFTIEGTISGALRIHYSYMESVTLQGKKFDIDVLRFGTSNEDYTDWRVCLRFLPKGFYEKTRMVTCEIAFPTGYIALDDSVDELNQLDGVVATVLRNDETQLSITFEEIGVQHKCFNVSGFRQNIETRQLPGTIKVFDVTDESNVAFKQLDTKT
uniref:Alpha-macroglobulin receptor-binding domain-containing protein n=1 Tax=Anopheles merus TaxID=30066 RepID=A0A182VN25_ANOME